MNPFRSIIAETPEFRSAGAFLHPTPCRNARGTFADRPTKLQRQRQILELEQFTRGTSPAR